MSESRTTLETVSTVLLTAAAVAVAAVYIYGQLTGGPGVLGEVVEGPRHRLASLALSRRRRRRLSALPAGSDPFPTERHCHGMRRAPRQIQVDVPTFLRATGIAR